MENVCQISLENTRWRVISRILKVINEVLHTMLLVRWPVKAKRQFFFISISPEIPSLARDIISGPEIKRIAFVA